MFLKSPGGLLMYKPFPDLVLKEMESFHIEEIVFVDPPALEPALKLREEGYQIYSIHTDPLNYRVYLSFIGGNYREVNMDAVSEALRALTRAKSSNAWEREFAKVLETAWEKLCAPEQGVVLWLLDKLLLWKHQIKWGQFLSKQTEFVQELTQRVGLFLTDTRNPHLSLQLEEETDISFIPGDAGIAFAGDIETLKYVRGAIARSRLARFKKPMSYRDLGRYFPHVPIWMILGLGLPEEVESVVSWMEKGRKRVRLTRLYREDNGRYHYLVVGWD